MPVDAEETKTVSPLILAEVITLFGDRPDPRSGAHVRFPLRGCQAKALLSGESEASIEIVDLGFSGVGFVSDRPFAVGQPVLIDFQHAGLPRQLWSCTVVRSTPLEDGVYRMGGAFCAAAAEQEHCRRTDNTSRLTHEMTTVPRKPKL